MTRQTREVLAAKIEPLSFQFFSVCVRTSIPTHHPQKIKSSGNEARIMLYATTNRMNDGVSNLLAYTKDTVTSFLFEALNFMTG